MCRTRRHFSCSGEHGRRSDRLALATDRRSRTSGGANTYRVSPSGALTAVGTTVTNGQMATCWLVQAGRYSDATNTASHTITGYGEAPDGQLAAARRRVSATTTKGPIDTAAAPNGRQVFELNGLSGDLRVFAVGPDCWLTLTGIVEGFRRSTAPTACRASPPPRAQLREPGDVANERPVRCDDK